MAKRMKKYKKEKYSHLSAMKDDEDMTGLKDEDLFVINEGKSEDIRKNRQKLKEDRFKLYNKERSHYEREKVKKLMERKPQPASTSKPKTRSHNVFDLWETPAEEMGIKYLRPSMKAQDPIRRVVVPHTGQSYNPPAAQHKELINRVVVEETEDMRRERLINEELNPDLRPEAEDLDEKIKKLKEYCINKEEYLKKKKKVKPEPVEPEVEDEDGPTKLSVNPPVDRENNLTFKQRRLRAIEREAKRERIIDKRMRQKAHKERPIGKKQLKALRSVKNYNKKLEDMEREKWETEGEVSKPRKLGLYKYQKPKVEFVPEEELPESFRKQKGTESLIRDQFDSFFRRNLLPKEAPANDRKKIKDQQYKLHNSTTEKQRIKDEKKQGDRALLLARERLRERKRKTALIRGLKAPKEKKDDDEEIIVI